MSPMAQVRTFVIGGTVFFTHLGFGFIQQVQAINIQLSGSSFAVPFAAIKKEPTGSFDNIVRSALSLTHMAAR